MKKINIAILGGDKRQEYLSDILSEKFNTYTFLVDNNEKTFEDFHKQADFDVYIFPIPISRDGITLNSKFEDYKLLDIVKKIPRNSVILGGSVTNEVEKIFLNENLKIVDYLKSEKLAILNAIPTAEGALQIAFEKMPITLAFSNSLVVGNGRIGKCLSKKLLALGSNTTVIARKKEDFADILSNNLKYSTLQNADLASFDVIFNTVPTRIFTRELLKKVPKNTLIIDLSSKPFGVDFDACEEFSIEAIKALSLPGKVAPKTASMFIFETILDILNDLEVI